MRRVLLAKCQMIFQRKFQPFFCQRCHIALFKKSYDLIYVIKVKFVPPICFRSDSKMSAENLDLPRAVAWMCVATKANQVFIWSFLHKLWKLQRENYHRTFFRRKISTFLYSCLTVCQIYNSCAAGGVFLPRFKTVPRFLAVENVEQ